MRKRIAILFHERQRGWWAPKRYAILQMADAWREMGHEVRLIFGARSFAPADLAILHVDLSVVPDEYLELAARYPRTLNGAVTDIRKSTFSTIRLGPGDRADGPVIVKSNLNCAGLPEQMIARGGLGLGSQIRNLRRSLPLFRSGVRPTRFRAPFDYRVYDRLSEVPPDVCRSPDWIVERFLPETDGELYYMRVLNFFGDRMTSLRIGSTEPIVKLRNIVKREEIEPDPRVAELRHALKFDFGKFDFVIHDGRPILLDVNKTPGEMRSASARAQTRLRYRAGGIGMYLS